MPPNKSQQGISWKTVAKILGGITIFIGSVVTWLDFIVHLQSGYKVFLWVGFVVFITIWFIVLWLLYKQKNKYGYIWLAVTLVALVIVSSWWTSNKNLEQEKTELREEKLVILIANFDGPEEVYGLRNEIKETLDADFSDDGSVEIETNDEIISPGNGIVRARELGEALRADIVIWGWYRPTKNPNVTLHIENISPKQFSNLGISVTMQPTATLDQLETFSFQQQIGKDISAFISLLKGQIANDQQNYVLEKGQYDIALNEINNAIALDPLNIHAYRNRAVLYAALGRFEAAIQDYTTIISYSPQFPEIYYERGLVYQAIGNFKLANADFDNYKKLTGQDAP